MNENSRKLQIFLIEVKILYLFNICLYLFLKHSFLQFNKRKICTPPDCGYLVLPKIPVFDHSNISSFAVLTSPDIFLQSRHHLR